MSHFDVDGRYRPQDDLYRYVNGRWLEHTEIPADKGWYGNFIELRDAAEDAVRDIVTGMSAAEPGSEPAKVADLYASFMDTDRLAALGLAPLQPVFAAIDAIDSPAALISWLGFAVRHGVGSLLSLYVDSDPGDPNRYVLSLYQSGLGLPDEEYYRLPEHEATRDAYRDHIGRMLVLAGAAADLAPLAAADIFDLETRIAACHWDKVCTRDIKASYNPVTMAELDEPWPAILAAAGAGTVTDVVNNQPSFFQDVAGLLTDVPLPTWQLWARWHVLSGLASYLTDDFVEQNFAFYGRTLRGIPELKPRWRRGIALVEGTLGEAVGKLYVREHFSSMAKTRMHALVAHLLEAYRRSINSLEWMTEATKVEALAKLDAFRSKIGYPDQWRDYSGLVVAADDLIGNVLRSAVFEFEDALAKLAGPIRDWEWFMTPQTVNAFYHSLRNEIVFPAAILQPPFFDENIDDAVNYGAIGAVIGHEIGHGFDDQGSTCDGSGALRDWWTAADRDAFNQRTSALIAQYQVLQPAETPGSYVNGELTIGENIGDLGGLAIAYLAWQLATEGQEVPLIDGYTGAQRFFFSWALSWQTKTRPETLKEQLATDPHAPAEFRCNQVVRNVDAFYEAFDVRPGDALWLDPAERVRIW